METVVEYLRHNREEVFCEAVSIVIGLSAEESQKSLIDDYSAEICHILLQRYPTYAAAKSHCLTALINITGLCSDRLSHNGFVRDLMEAVTAARSERDWDTIKSLIIALSNATREIESCQEMLREELLLWRIIQFYHESRENMVHREAYHHVANLLINITSFAEGREWFIKGIKAYLLSLLKNVEIGDRRLSTLQFIKNLCADTDLVELDEFDVHIIISHLIKLVYPKESQILNYLQDHEDLEFRAISAEIRQSAIGVIPSAEERKLVIEIISSLLRVVKGREAGRSLGLYEVLRVWHIIESDTEILTGIEDVVSLVHYTEDELINPPEIPPL